MLNYGPVKTMTAHRRGWSTLTIILAAEHREQTSPISLKVDGNLAWNVLTPGYRGIPLVLDETTV